MEAEEDAEKVKLPPGSMCRARDAMNKHQRVSIFQDIPSLPAPSSSTLAPSSLWKVVQCIYSMPL